MEYLGYATIPCMSDMNDIRRGIDAVDDELLDLLNRRMELVLRLKKLKKEIVDPERELEVFRHIRSWSKNLIDAGFSERLFREIVAESRRLQERRLTVIGFQGEHGAYGESAAIAYNPEYVPLPCREFIDVFDGIANDQLDLGIVPVENSREGPIASVNDLIKERRLPVIGEIVIPIRHHLLAARGTGDRDIRVVYSHPQALAQCRDFIARNNIEPRPFYDTAGAAKMIARGETASAAAIASGLCAELYNLEVIKENIEDQAGNATKFVILSRNTSTGEKS